MPTFQRARTDEQRAQRRAVILRTAAAMLTEMPVAELSLNELSRRVGLAKSNVLRYFESREAVLLELLDQAVGDWLDDLACRLPEAPDPSADAGLPVRVDQVAAVMARTLAERPVLCDLVGAQAAVLERNVSPTVAARFKRSAIASVGRLAELVGRSLPELGDDAPLRFAGATVMLVGALWAHTQPSAAMLAAYEAEPDLAALRLDFEATAAEMLGMLLSGLLVRRPTTADVGKWRHPGG